MAPIQSNNTRLGVRIVAIVSCVVLCFIMISYQPINRVYSRSVTPIMRGLAAISNSLNDPDLLKIIEDQRPASEWMDRVVDFPDGLTISVEPDAISVRHTRGGHHSGSISLVNNDRMCRLYGIEKGDDEYILDEYDQCDFGSSAPL